MIRLGAAALPALGESYRAARALIVPDAIEPAGAAGLRIRVQRAGLSPYWLADRGRYQLNDSLADPVLFERLRALAEAVTGEPLAVGPFRWLLFGPGDYALVKDSRGPTERMLEVTLDFSEATSGAAGIVYQRGQEAVASVPQLAESLAVVDRPPGTLRFERYVSRRFGHARVLRLRLALLPR